MTVARRIAKLEASLSPKEAVFHWLDEAHAFPSPSAYLSWLLTQPRDAYPLVGIPKRVEQAARESLRGRQDPDADTAVRQAVSDAVFLVGLVLGIVGRVEDTIKLESLRAAALVWWMRAISSEGPAAEVGTDAWSSWLSVASIHVSEIRVVDATVGRIAERYLDGRDCLFPGTRREWTDLRERADALLTVGEQVPTPGVQRDGAAMDRMAETASTGATDMIVKARADALDAVDQTEVALGLVEDDLRSRLAVR